MRAVLLRQGVLAVLVLGFECGSGQLFAAEEALDEKSQKQGLDETIVGAPADEGAIDRFAEQVREQFAEAKRAGSDQARAVVDDATRVVGRIEPANDRARERVAELKETIDFYRRLLDANDADIRTLEERVKANPDDLENFLLYGIKFQLIDDSVYQKESVQEAHARLDHVASVLQSTRVKTAERKIADECEALLDRIERFHKKRIAEVQARLSLVGTAAVLPTAEHGSWLNGPALRAQDLEGKVVLLDFWALWCGPCIAGFPKVAAWHEEYQDKGLVVIAAALQEDDGAENGTQAERITALFRDKELRFACVIDEGKLFEAYRVAGVPHYALIDRQGKIRIVRSGNNATSLADFEAEIEKLLAEETAEQ